MSSILHQLTGRSLDSLSVSLGLRSAYRLKYGTIEFNPVPKIKKVRSEPISTVGPNELTASAVQKWKVSIPLECADLFPSIAAWESSLESGARWQVTLPNKTAWVDTIVEGDRLDGERGRVVITLAAIGLDY